MAIRRDDSTIIILPDIEQFKNKASIRQFLLSQWISENPQTKYRYFAETFKNGARIYLERPGRLNKGCDFVIYAENAYLWNNGNDRPPDHDFILGDLEVKKENLTDVQWKTLLIGIDEVFNVGRFSNIISSLSKLPNIGHDYELLLKLIRWFLIEQDLTYWSGEGRDMFYNAIHEL